MYEFTTEETFERWRQNEYKAALELGYTRADAAKILQMENRNDILRYMRDLRKEGPMKSTIKKLTIEDVKDPEYKDYETCFYFDTRRNACQCLNKTYCKIGCGGECSFWLNKNTTKWGETIYQGHKVKHPISMVTGR